MYALPIQKLIDAFEKLPSVGARTAERYVFHILKSGKKEAGELASALTSLVGGVKSCEICCNFSDRTPCRLCVNKNRDQSTICIVAEPQDAHVIENTHAFSGLYHILRGTLRPDEIEPEKKIKIRELLKRIQDPKIKEIILSLNPDMSGEMTAMYIAKSAKTQRPDLRITRLARGLPMGSDIRYADEMTLISALKNRR
ncbi:MAG TPA: recombination mediator RecR [Candidatus Magasanikbacteria bacterium]|nr:recombination mediator RecR [Candidatus Magasanikbacteria bacterium]